MWCADEIRATAAAQLVEQRGKKKADDELLRFLDFFVPFYATVVEHQPAHHLA